MHEMPAEFSRYVTVVLRGPLLIPSHPQPKEGSWLLELFRDAGASSPCWQIPSFGGYLPDIAKLGAARFPLKRTDDNGPQKSDSGQCDSDTPEHVETFLVGCDYQTFNKLR
jgi:hypothetical protein